MDATSATAATDDVVGIRAAASRLGVAASTISRQVRAGIIPNRGSDSMPKVSIEEAKRARAENLEPSHRVDTFQAKRTEHESIKAQKAAIELGRMRGELVAKVEVEDFIATAARALRDSMLRRWRTMSVELVGLSAREIEAAGLSSDEALLKDIADAFAGAV